MICPACGAWCPVDAVSCSGCGKLLRAPTGPGQTPAQLSQQASPRPPGYEARQPAYPRPQTGNAVPQPGNAVPPPGYTGPQPGYTEPQPGNAVPPPGYTGPQPGYTGPQAEFYAHSGSARPQVPYPQTTRRSLGGLGVASAIFLIISALGSAAAIVESRLSGWASITTVPAGIMCLIWFWRARKRAEQSGWPQPLSAGWTLWGWVVPVVFLWFPFKIMAGIWRASQPVQNRTRPMGLVAAWWSCWLLAWFTGFSYVTTPASVLVPRPTGLYFRTSNGFVAHTARYWFEGTIVSKAFAVLAAVLLAVLVGQASSRLDA